MENAICLHIPLGYRIEETMELMPVWQAERRLLSTKGSIYTRAVRRGADAELYARWVICPYCGARYLANGNSALFAHDGQANACRITKESVAAWASLQTTLFEDARVQELTVAPSIDIPQTFPCHACDREVHEDAAERLVQLERTGKRVRLRCEVVRLDEVLTPPWLRIDGVSLAFPLTEVLTFHLGTGRVYVCVENGDGRVLYCRDVTDHPDWLQGSATHKMLSQSKVVLRHVRRLFEAVWGGALPYTWRQIDVVALFRMTRFVGYSREFYDCVPYTCNDFGVDRAFLTRAKRMHRARDVARLYERLALPSVKSIRRMVFTQPGLLFYAEGICDVWEVLGDYNLLARFLRHSGVYMILSELYMRPGMLEYMRDYAAVKGGVYLLSDMEADWGRVCRLAVDYASMSPCLRRKMQSGWRRRRDMITAPRRACSVPMSCPDTAIADCTVDGYEFRWLRSSNDYAAAAAQLQNCLCEWSPANSPVIGVRKRERFVAAIEVYDGYVIQARGRCNRDIQADPVLSAAFDAWMTRYGLQWGARDDDWEIPEDLPF